jgi:hypothetical protein
MSQFLKWYRWVNILSLDVVTGAVICASYFASLQNLRVDTISLFVLGISVWIVYTADHLKDAYLLKKLASTDRHQFHQQNFRSLSLTVGAAIATAGVLAFQIGSVIFTSGASLAALILIYLIVNNHLKFMKELVGAILYCAGVFLPSLSEVDSVSHFLLRPDCILFLILVLVNLLLFSWYEVDQDVEDKHESFALYFGKPATLIVIKSLFILFFILLIATWGNMKLSSLLVFMSMTVALLLIVAFPNFFKRNSRYRYWGDLIFIFPGIALLA